MSVTIKRLSLFKLTIIPAPETQKVVTETLMESFTFSFESWFTEKKPVITSKEFPLEISSASIIKAPFSFLAAHQRTQGRDPSNPSQTTQSTIQFLIMLLIKKIAEVDGIRYPKGPYMINYTENIYLDQ